jgi:hypothetical protein
VIVDIEFQERLLKALSVNGVTLNLFECNEKYGRDRPTGQPQREIAGA